jgi:hypothetical protein
MAVPLRTVRDFEAIEEEAEGSDLIEEDLRGDSERGIGDDIVEDERIEAVVGRSGAWTCGLGAVGRKLRTDGDIVRIVVIDAAADDQIAGKEINAAVVIVVLSDGWNGDESGN